MIANKRTLWFISFFIDKHIVIAPWLVNELKEKDVSSEFYPTPIPYLDSEIKPLPKDFTILAYLGYEGKENFYGKKIIDKLIENYPAKFIILGSKQTQKNENLLFLGNVNHKDMAEIYAKSTVLIRLTEHDGFSNMVQEALQCGRYVIWSKHYDYTIYAETYDDVVERLKFISEFTEPNYSGADNYSRDLNSKVSAEKFVKLYIEVLK
jgi:hypothetical protein